MHAATKKRIFVLGGGRGKRTRFVMGCLVRAEANLAMYTHIHTHIHTRTHTRTHTHILCVCSVARDVVRQMTQFVDPPAILHLIMSSGAMTDRFGDIKVCAVALCLLRWQARECLCLCPCFCVTDVRWLTSAPQLMLATDCQDLVTGMLETYNYERTQLQVWRLCTHPFC